MLRAITDLYTQRLDYRGHITTQWRGAASQFLFDQMISELLEGLGIISAVLNEERTFEPGVKYVEFCSSVVRLGGMFRIITL